MRPTRLPTNGTDAETPVQPPPEEEAANSAREIDIYLGQLAHATKVNDGRGIGLAHESLKQCRPHELVDERVLAALEPELNAFVRTQFFAAYHAEEAKLAWASLALELRAGKFLGTDETYEPGEEAELGVYAKLLVARTMAAIHDGKTDYDARVRAFLRSLLDTERPPWALELLLPELAKFALERDSVALAKSLELELRGFLERGTAAAEWRDWAFFVYALSVPDAAMLLGQLESPALRPYVATLLRLLDPWPGPELVMGPKWELELTYRIKEERVALAGLLQRTLSGSAPATEKRVLIEVLARHHAPKVRELLEAGIQRKDANLGDYLAAWGYRAQSADDLKLLAESAAAADSATATGAIEGLRQCTLPEAATELARIIEQSGNPGVQSQALGALLARDAANAPAIVEGYLGTDRDAAVRAVAVAHIPVKNIDRMKKVIDEDASPRVRQAALTRLGEMKDKKLRSYFNSVAINDPQPLIRQQAKKYADELKDE